MLILHWNLIIICICGWHD